MATIEFRSVERRRQLTIVAIGAGLFAITLPINNQRALFSPLGDVPLLGELSPVAYSVIVGGPGGGVGGPRNRGGGTSGGPRGGANPLTPSAFAARVPGAPSASVPASPTTSGFQPLGLANNSPLGTGNTPSGIGGVPGGGGAPSGGGPTAPGGSTGGGGGGAPPPNPTGAVPEPATWLTMILGFGVVGAIMRQAQRRRYAAARPPVSLLSEG